jgi:oxygen-independent coproporphyrinogen-3 oxidase
VSRANRASSSGPEARPDETSGRTLLGLYLHVPFCSAICSYCNFNRGLFDADLKARYVAALDQEIRSAPFPFESTPTPRHVDSIFFGGGTPSLLEPSEIGRLIEACRSNFQIAADAEVTLETNPETATEERLAAFRQAGVNRISFGVQSFDDEELARLGRIHSAERAREAILQARRAGFANLSFDLMLWLPGQSFSSWLRTVDEAVALEPDHLSLYLLELYPNAPLKEAMARATSQPWAQAPDDEAADMYLAGLDRLDLAGYEQYEISNVSKPGLASRHNLKYWQGGDWYGFGCGAHSTVNGWRWRNLASTSDYVRRVEAGEAAAESIAQQSPEERFTERMFTGLRLSEGIDTADLAARFGRDPWALYGAELAPFLEAGMMWRRGARIGLTRQGMLVANEILTTFV